MPKDSCYMIKPDPGGGGNAAFLAKSNSEREHATPVILRRTAALGDALCATVVADKLISMKYEVTMQSHPHCHCLLKRHPGLYDVTEPNGFAHIDLDRAYEDDPQRRQKHFHQMFFEKAQLQLRARGIFIGEPLNCKPKIRVGQNVKHTVRQRFSQYDRPWVFVCPRSDSYNVRNVPDWIWEIVAEKTSGTKFWIGRHPAPKNFVDLNCRHFDNVIEYLSVADLLITVDTGPMHVAAALGIPIVAISQSSSPELHLNDQNDFVAVAPKLDCLNCQQNLCPKSEHTPPCQSVDPELIASWANARLKYRFSNDVSAIVPIYQPEVATLNRCLEAVLPQVSEVIVTGEGYSRVPAGALQHPKIKYVQKFQNQIGYGRNVNFGARHSNGKYLLLLNDDVFLDPEAVSRMKFEMDAEVGLVAHLLRYPDGTIYHAGKARSPGMRGWGHIDYRHIDPSIKQPCDMENVCGASVLVRREAFYGIDCFDEEFFVYGEDDDFNLRLRKAGWRIRYTPHASGIHMEHQSTQKLGSIEDTVGKANAIFGRKWSRYLDHNINRVPGNFDYET